MGRYNTVKTDKRSTKTSPLKTVSGKATTATGGAGYRSDAKSELFRLGVNLFAGGEKTFHENATGRDSRFGQLVSQLAVSDPQWTLDFLHWLRDEGNVRTASILGAMYALHARLNHKSKRDHDGFKGYNRQFAALIPQRLDEIGEMFKIWDTQFGKPFPQPLKRGAGDALNRLTNEYSVMKYDTDSHDWRIADVLAVTHLRPKTPEQNELFKFAVSDRFGNSDTEFDFDLLPMIKENISLRKDVKVNPLLLLNADRLKVAGMTWEDALSLAGIKVPKNQLWDALILGGSVGYMAMLRNLRNFEEAGISPKAVKWVQDKLSDPRAVAKSRQFPFRFWSAAKNTNSSKWVDPLETALQLSTGNIPELPGKTLILIDTSGSMSAAMSNNSSIRRDEAAALFAAAVAIKNAGRVDVHMFADRHAPVRVTKGGSVLKIVREVMRRNGEVGYGTQTVRAVRDLFSNHDRVLIFTDMQSFRDHYSGTIDSVVPKDKYVYAWDLAGYQHGDIPSGTGTRHQLSGLTDATFKVIPLLERGQAASWPWENLD